MKALLTFFSITLAALSAFAQHINRPELESVRSEYFILDSFYHWGWDTTAFDWNLKDRTLYTTDANQNVTSELAILLDSMGQWTNSQLTTRTYNAENNLTNEVIQLWDGAVWVNSSQNVYTYDGDDNQTVISFQNWTGVDWVNSFQQVFTFDNNHNQLTRTTQHWTGTDWADGTRQVSTYDVNNKITMRLFQNYISGWNDVSQSLYTYDANGDLDILLYQKWNFNTWNDDYRNLYDFDAHHNRILILEQLALGVNVWEDQDKYEYSFDQYDHITHLIYTHNENNVWSNVYQFNLINDDDQNRATEVFQTWNNGWVNVDSTQYYYTGITGVRDQVLLNSIQLWPNPSNDWVNIGLDSNIDGQASVYSMQGIKVADMNCHESDFMRLDISSWMPGQYVFVFRFGHGLIAKSFQKQ